MEGNLFQRRRNLTKIEDNRIERKQELRIVSETQPDHELGQSGEKVTRGQKQRTQKTIR